MEIYDYKTAGGKNVITDYIDSLPKAEKQNLEKALNRAKNEGLL